MNKVLAIVAAMIALPTLASAGGRDGHWWRDLSSAQKSAYVVGFMDGRASGAVNVIIDASRSTTGSVKAWSAVEIKKPDAAQNATYGQIQDGLNKAYEDFRNRSIEVFNVVDIVLQQISGSMNVAQAEEAFQTWRKLYSRTPPLSKR